MAVVTNAQLTTAILNLCGGARDMIGKGKVWKWKEVGDESENSI